MLVKIYERTKSLPPVYKGIFLLTLSSFFFSCMSLMVRLSGDLPIVQKSFFRNLISAILVLIFFIWQKEKVKINRSNLSYLVLRSLIGSIGILANYYALSNLQLGNATMLQKLSPFATLIFSFFILKEGLSSRQIFYIIGAFASSILVIKPDVFSFDFLPSIIGLLGGLSAGLAYVYVRKLRILGTTGPTIVLFFSLFSSLLMLPFTIYLWQNMTTFQLIYLIFAGFFAFLAQLAITAAYGYAKAKEISIYDYGQVLYAMLLALIFFGEFPDFVSLLGYILIFVFAFLNFINSRKYSS